MAAVGLLVVTGAIAAMAIVVFLLKAIFWLVLLPLRLIFFGLVAIPLFLVKLLFGGVLFGIVAPVVGATLLVALLVLALALFLPLLPLVLFVALIWFLVRTGTAATVSRA